jgi:hypothetical protein
MGCGPVQGALLLCFLAARRVTTQILACFKSCVNKEAPEKESGTPSLAATQNYPHQQRTQHNKTQIPANTCPPQENSHFLHTFFWRLQKKYGVWQYANCRFLSLLKNIEVVVVQLRRFMSSAFSVNNLSNSPLC